MLNFRASKPRLNNEEFAMNTPDPALRIGSASRSPLGNLLRSADRVTWIRDSL